MPYKIILTPAFKHCLKQLEKRYPKIKEDAKTAIHQLIQTPCYPLLYLSFPPVPAG